MMDIFLTGLAPLFWGTTYSVTTEFLKGFHPFHVALIRALPAGLVILLVTRKLPTGGWWWKSLVLGTLNIGLFFALLFAATYRIPGGIAATIGAIQPFLVMLFSWLLTGERPSFRALLLSLICVFGVSLIVLGPVSDLDLLGLAAAAGAAVSMAAGIALTKKWKPPVSLLAFTGWQLVAGGLVLLPLCLVLPVEIPPVRSKNLIGFLWLAGANTVFAYALWFRGIQRMKAWQVSFLGLLSPVAALFVGVFILHQNLSPSQAVGVALVFASIILVNRAANQKKQNSGQIPGPVQELEA